MYSEIVIRGAHENNLKNIDVNIPKNKLVVLTGLSGSGKSSLAYDTLQKECQRQYMESMGMTTDFISKPKVESILGLSPSISIDQRMSNRSPRSTVGTSTEISTYLRVLFTKLGVRECLECGGKVLPSFSTEEGQGEFSLNEEDAESSVKCPHCGCLMPELSMGHFSFNKPQGACETCTGLGMVYQADWDSLIDDTKSINEGAVREWDIHYIKRNRETFAACGKHYGFEFDVAKPVCLLSRIEKDLLFYGVNHEEFKRHFPGITPPETASSGRFEGIATNILRRYAEHGDNAGYQKKMEKSLVKRECPSCKGERLKEYSRKVTIEGKSIIALSNMPLIQLSRWIKTVRNRLPEQAEPVAAPIINNLEERVDRLLNSGIDYLSLNRGMTTLSGGEAQRLRLASLLGSGLTGVLYVLDEPTTGLHARDTQKLLCVLRKLRDMGNTVLVIEHDTDMMLQADHIIDMGPQAGRDGGRIVACGTPEEIMEDPDSITGKYLKRLKEEIVRKKRRESKEHIIIRGAVENNLKNIDVSIPLEKLTAVTGVSGSGKSTLVFDILDKAASKKLSGAKVEPGRHTAIAGLESIQRIVTVDQASIGRSPGSNAATYTDVFTPIRNLFSGLSYAKALGLNARDFSFNVAGGRCERCEGAGVLTVEMHFLPDVEITCPVCKGKRFKKNVLSVRYQGKSISDILEMTIEEGYKLFKDRKEIASKLKVLVDVGLGYLKLGQPATTLSGGEAQRVKLAKELSRSGKGAALYLLDEPTTGLHPEDVQKLMLLLQKLVDTGNTVCVVEHNLELIRAADWIIDMGPEGGEDGGRIVAQGTPEDIMKAENSYTGKYL